jgi:hypothetical protein
MLYPPGLCTCSGTPTDMFWTCNIASPEWEQFDAYQNISVRFMSVASFSPISSTGSLAEPAGEKLLRTVCTSLLLVPYFLKELG